MNEQSLNALAAAIAPVVLKHIAQIAGTINKRLDDIEARLAPVEGRMPERGERGEAGPIGPAGPPGPPGERGADGAPGRNGDNGRDGQPGVPGREGAPGKNGKDGVDGLGFDDLVCSYDDERTFTLTFRKGEQSKSFDFRMPIPIDRGPWNGKREYQRGDFVSWRGNAFVARCDTSAVPGDSPDWRLAVRAGRDGKAGKDGVKGERGERGKEGNPWPSA